MDGQVNRSVTLRGVLKFNVDKSKSISIDEVEPAKEIVKRFNTGAMSLGWLASKESFSPQITNRI
jgi:glutamate synthase domain-containing protein 2